MADNSAFISYRRAPGYAWARLIWEDLGELGVDAFLDLESMRAAGRFDERLLNQIASRPYFLVVLTPDTLERCTNVDDWMRREIEHAIATNRIIIPVFIAPFEPSGFPADLPPHIDEALSQSQGLTIYSQYLRAAIEKLAHEMLTPVDLASIGLTEDDARFESETVREIESLPAPTVPVTPAPVEPPPDLAEPVTEPLSGLAEPTVPDLVEPTGPGEPPSELVPTETVPAEPLAGTEPISSPPSEREPEPAPVEPPATTEPVVPTDDRRRLLVMGGAAAVALIAVIAIVAAVSGGGDTPSTTTAVVLPPTTPTTASPGGVVHDAVLEAGVWLRAGDSVGAAEGDHRLVMTESGRLQLLTGGTVVWQPSYEATPTAAAILQPTDGNFVVYRRDDATSGVLWASGTSSVGPGAVVAVVDDDGSGHVVIEDADGHERWRMPEADPGGDGAGPAQAELDVFVAIDRGFLADEVDVWVVQLGAKRDGLEEDGPWDHERILDEFLDLADEFGFDADVVLASGGDFNLNRAHRLDASARDFTEWYFALLLDDFSTRDEAIEWCETNRPGNCGVRLLSDDPVAEPHTYFSPSSG